MSTPPGRSPSPTDLTADVSFKGRERAVTERDPVEDGDYTRDARRLRVSLWLLAVERQHLDVREKDVLLLKTGWANLV